MRRDLVEAQRSKAVLEAKQRDVTDELEKLKAKSKAESKRIQELTGERMFLMTRLRDRDEELRGKAKLLEVRDNLHISRGITY